MYPSIQCIFGQGRGARIQNKMYRARPVRGSNSGGPRVWTGNRKPKQRVAPHGLLYNSKERAAGWWFLGWGVVYWALGRVGGYRPPDTAKQDAFNKGAELRGWYGTLGHPREVDMQGAGGGARRATRLALRHHSVDVGYSRRCRERWYLHSICRHARGQASITVAARRHSIQNIPRAHGVRRGRLEHYCAKACNTSGNNKTHERQVSSTRRRRYSRHNKCQNLVSLNS